MPFPPRVTRLLAVAAAVAFVALGLGIRAADGEGDLAQYSGTALYASMVYAAVLFARPRGSAPVAGAVAIGFCWAVEVFQLTGIPAELSAHSLAARLALGVAFDPTDLAWYPVGVIPLAVLHWTIRRRSPAVRPLVPRRSPAQPQPPPR